MSCIRKAEVGICLVFWFKSKDVALVIGDEAQAGSEKSPASNLGSQGSNQLQVERLPLFHRISVLDVELDSLC